MTGRARSLRVAIGILPLLASIVPFGGCKSRPVDHTPDVEALVGWRSAPPSKPSGFEPVADLEHSDLPTLEPQPYRLGVGDLVEVRVLPPTSVPGLEDPVVGVVKEDGSLVLPVARRVAAADKTPRELEDEIAELLKEYSTAPLVTVDVSDYRARKCRIVGEGVEEEQVLPVNGRLTLLEALILTGATRSEKADREEAYLIRDGKVYPFSIASLVERGDPASDFILAQGDHVVVPSVRERQDHVYVFGQVARPGRFEMEHLGRVGVAGKLTLTGAIGLAGGISEGQADCNRICVIRGSWKNIRIFRLGVRDLYHAGESIALEPGDRVYVAPNDLARFNMGLQQFLPSVSTVGTLTALFLSAAAYAESGP